MTLNHQPVLLEEVLNLFNAPIDTLVDATLGAGGHSLALVQAHPELKQWVGIDRDAQALELAAGRLTTFLPEHRQLLHSDFSSAAPALKKLPWWRGADALLFDLGVSSMQLDQLDRGFSFRGEAPLDMRMDRGQSESAATLINRASAAELEELLRELGEEPKARAAARRIVQARAKKPIETTQELTQALHGLWHGSRRHEATRTFQALRMAVNQELEQLSSLSAWMELLRPGGRMVVIAFHSIEDRSVKNQMRQWVSEGKGSLLVRKPLTASPQEIRINKRSRSAKLRGFIKGSAL